MSRLIAYAQNFASFLLSSLSAEHLGKIKSIILFGSAARGEAAKESDVDIFIDVFEDEKQLEKKVEQLVNDFYSSIFFEKYWRLLGIENDVKPIVGRLDKWRDLKTSIIANGIILYGKYTAKTKGKNFVILSWAKIKPESKRVWLSKLLYGYTYEKRTYAGLLEVHKCQKLGSNCILVPIESYKEILGRFRQSKIPVKIFHISLI